METTKNIHKINIISIPNLYRVINSIDKKDTLIIQIQHRGKNEYDIIKTRNAKVLSFVFDDVNKGDDGFITKNNAKIIGEISKSLKNIKGLNIYISCYAGLSRSPAIGIVMYMILHNETKNSYYGFRASDLMDTYIYHNKDIVQYIMDVYNEENSNP